MNIINGKAIAKSKRDAIKADIKDNSLSPALAIILANDVEASRIYVHHKIKACEEIGITPRLHELPIETSTDNLISLIQTLNEEKNIHGIFVQLPLPDHHDSQAVIQSIAPEKDIDGLTVSNLGKVMSDDQTGLTPCTPQGVMSMLAHEKVDLTGKHAVIIGRSLLFGKPMGQLLLNANCTVTYCHSKTIDIQTITKQADILIAATGQPKMVTSEWVKNDAIVIDVGITRLDDGTLSGDVDFDDVSKKATKISPVPGGVGPMTIASLLANTVKACKSQI
jgi:methylenetetrahydrofolate dehydrogenase (NADP+)/methenyltetrahydrofolate cyclohydrolase